MVQPVGLEPLMTYDEFKTGLTFAEVSQELRREQRQAFDLEGRRMFITRHTILGRWHQIKLSAYADYKRWMRGSYAEG